jgi:RNA-binding protein YlmH
MIRDTVATLRLDAVAASGFSLSGAGAADLISAGRVSVNHLECDKPDRTIAQGDVDHTPRSGKNAWSKQ